MALDPNSEKGYFDSSIIDESLQQILQSEEFSGALQLQALLQFIVENSINGHDDALKERIIGMNVFGRKLDYETADDPIVRSRVRQLRKRLELYYKSESSSRTPLKIVIPKGSYKPAFVVLAKTGYNGCYDDSIETPLLAEPSQDTSKEHPESKTAPSAPALLKSVPRRWWKTVTAQVCAVLACALLLGLAATFSIAKWRAGNIDLLWMPIFNNKKTVIIYSGSTEVYLPSSIYNYNALSLQPDDQDQPASPGGGLIPLTEGLTLTAKDLVLTPYRYVRSEEVETNLTVATFLNSHHVHMESRVEPDLPYVDLHGSPVVLLGAYNNDWSLKLTQDLPYFFDRRGRIHERGGQGRTWSTPPAKDEKIAQDYAVIARLLDSRTGAPAMVIAGITVCGTQAAADFATDPVQLRKLDNFPKYALAEKSFELVIHTSLINCNPTSLDIVASRYW